MNQPLVKMVAVTAGLLPEALSAEEFIAYAARVSNPSNQANQLTAPKLLKYMVEHNHWSPFEMAHVVLEINTTRDIARQILRHRSFSFQEFSQRYANVDELGGGQVIREARLQDLKNRQSSHETENDSLQSWWESQQKLLGHVSKDIYQEALNRGIAKEVARSVLPEGMTTSRLYMAGSVRSWIHYIWLRTDPATQKEHRQVAEACRALLLTCLPSLSEVL